MPRKARIAYRRGRVSAFSNKAREACYELASARESLGLLIWYNSGGRKAEKKRKRKVASTKNVRATLGS